MFSKKIYSDDERIRQVWDVIEVKKLMARRTYDNAFALRKKEMDELWVQKPENKKTASYGRDYGYVIGYDNIYKEYVADFEKNSTVGTTQIHSLSTPLVKIAGDGKTAQGVWYSPGQVTTPDDAKFVYTKFFVDFIKEDDEWKIWHLFVGTEYEVSVGASFEEDMPLEKARHPEKYPPLPRKSDAGFFAAEAYSMKYNYCHLKPLPDDYQTFSETVSYGPEGDPAYHKEV